MKNKPSTQNIYASIKKISIHMFVLFSLVFLAHPLPTFSVVMPEVLVTASDPGSSPCGSAQTGQYESPICASSLSQLLSSILDVVIQLGAVVVVFFIIMTGFKYIMARGNPGDIEKAHASLAWTLVGAGVVLGAKVISLAIQGTVQSLH